MDQEDIDDHLKERALSNLREAMRAGRVDDDIVPLLDRINSFPWFATTSSCSGRFQVICVPEVGDKVGAEVVGKWHKEVALEELGPVILRALGFSKPYLMVQPLLLHVRCLHLNHAVALRRVGQEAGLKYSMIRSLKLDRSGAVPRWGAMVELLGTERMEIPLEGLPPGAIEQALPAWTSHGNELLRRTKAHVPVLMSMLDAFEGASMSAGDALE